MEADEYDKTISAVSSHIVIVTNVDREHLVAFKDGMEQYQAMIISALNRAQKVVLCYDDPWLRRIKEKLTTPVLTYGWGDGADYRIKDMTLRGDFLNPKTEFSFVHKQKKQTASICVWGKYNVLNAVGAYVVSRQLGVPVQEASGLLKTFKGVGRRFECVRSRAGALMITDYAHHPREIKVLIDLLTSLKVLEKSVIIFQPHLLSRTQSLFYNYVNLLKPLTRCWVMDVFGAREKGDTRKMTENLVACTNQNGGQSRAIGAQKEARLFIKQQMKDRKDLIYVFIGAGDINDIVFYLK